MQYRRLTAHLQTGSADFNRRLSAYLTNHVAMRTALDQAITNSYAQQYPNAPQFAHNHSMYPSPFMAQPMPQQQSPLSYNQSYPTPSTPTYQHTQQARQPSVSQGTPRFSPQGMTAPSPIQGVNALPQMERRPTSGSAKSASHSPHGAPATPQSATSRPAIPQTASSHNIKQEGKASQQMKAPPQPSPQIPQHPFGTMNGYGSISPFTTSLPMESQMLLGSALDPNDPMTSMLMAGSENMPQPFTYNTSSSLQKPRAFSQPYDGMSATLAPSALDMSPRHHGYPQSSTTMPSPLSTSPASYDASIPDFSKSQFFQGPNSSTGSGTVTPGGMDGGWDAFINETPWAENAT